MDGKAARRLKRMEPYLGAESQFYEAMRLMLKGLTDGEVRTALRALGYRRALEDDVMRVLRALLSGTASRGTLGAAAWHVGKDTAPPSGRREQAYRLLDAGKTRADLMRELKIGAWAAESYVERWEADRYLRGEE